MPIKNPKIAKVFDDLDAWRDHCRFNGLKFDEADLYKSAAWKDWMNGGTGRPARPTNHSAAGKKPFRK